MARSDAEERHAAHFPDRLDEGVAALVERDETLAGIVATLGVPRYPRRRPGFATLLHIVLEQQVSIAAAAGMFRTLNEACPGLAPADFLGLDEATLRRCGFSRQKAGYARHLAEAIVADRFDPLALGLAGDEEAIARLAALKGFGRWSAEIYLMMALGRPDIWPAGDLALRRAAAECHPLGDVAEPAFRAFGERFRPWRSAASCLFWQAYLHRRGRTAPVALSTCTVL